MKPMPTSDVAMPFNPTRNGTARVTDKLNGEADTAVLAGDVDGDRIAKFQNRTSTKAAEKADVNADGSQEKATFDAFVEDIAEPKTTTEIASVVMDFTSPQLSALSHELAALFQGMPVPGVGDNVVRQNAVIEDKSGATGALARNALAPADSVSEDMSRLAEQLAARASSFGRSVASAAGPVTPASPAGSNNVHISTANTAVSVSALQAKTGFDAPVKVTSSQQRWFQAAAPLLAGIATSMVRTEAKANEAASAVNKQPSEAASFSADASLPESTIAASQPVSNQNASDHGNDNKSSRDGSKSGATADAAIGFSNTISGVRESILDDANTAVAPPYQQIRAAVAEAIVGATSAQRTDYVSLYADRPASSNLTLKTLEISLEPPDLGRVNVKMNLASRDLKLEIEASKASTAQMIANDQASLKRELLSDNVDLSSVMVSVTNAVLDAGPASGLSNNDQQFSGNSRAATENAFASTTSGGRDERKQPQSSDVQDSGALRQHREADVDVADARSSGKALYI